MTDDEQAGPAWAKGYPVPYLKQVTALFREHDDGLLLGAFSRYSELDAATDLAAGRLHVYPAKGTPEVAWVGSTLTRQRPIRDFTGDPVMALPGSYYVTRMAWRRPPAELTAALTEHRAVAVVQAWQEHPGERALVASLGLTLAAVKISAASEYRGIYGAGAQLVMDPADVAAIERLPLRLPAGQLRAMLAWAEGAAYADHYSGYNKAGAWSALALRGFYPADPLRIEKPAEMSKRWKADHAADLALTAQDTALWCPEAAALLAHVPNAGFERVRLMRLAPGGGELTRHADITDPDAGATPGKLARLHFPLVTTADCRFNTWLLSGERREVHMAVGGCYYLDTRKAHTAANLGATERIHLVADTWVNDELHELLAALGTGEL